MPTKVIALRDLACFMLLLSAIGTPHSYAQAADEEEKSAAFSHTIPKELMYSDFGISDSDESEVAEALRGEDPIKRVAAARALWKGHSRPYAQAVLKIVSEERLKTKDFPDLKKEVEESLKPPMVLRELTDGDYRWGAWLAMLRPHKDFVPVLLSGLAKRPEYTPETLLSLGKSKDRRALRPLREALKNNKGYETAAQALGYLGFAEAEPELIKSLSTDDLLLQALVCQALAAVGTERSLPALQRMAEDNRFTGAINVRGCAMDRVVGIERRHPELDRRGPPQRELKLLATFRGHKGLVWDVAFSPNGKLLASASDDGTVRLWDRTTGLNTATFPGNNPQMMQVAFMPDGKALACSGHGTSNGIQVLDIATGKTLTMLRGPFGAIRSFTISPKGKLVASSEWDGVSKRQVLLWDLTKGPTFTTLIGADEALAFHPGGELLAATDSRATKTIKIWEVKTRNLSSVLRGFTDNVMCAAFSPDRRTLTTGEEWSLKFWDIRSGKNIMKYRADSTIYNIAYSPDGKSIAVGDRGNPIRIWDTTSRKYSVAPRGVHPVAFSPDGSTLATGSADRNEILLWEIPRDKQR